MAPPAIRFGVFIVPDATDGAATLEQIIEADRCGLDIVGVQDHPYQWRFFDTWTLLAYAAGRTERVRLVPDVLNLPLRLPTLIAKSVASLDVLSGGRVELGIGAGAFWDAVVAMGGPRRTPKESVDALEEALAILRGFWSGERSMNFDGEHYQVNGAHPGPLPVHPVGIWLGAYGPRMLRLTGRLADGWLPSLGGNYLTPEDATKAHAAIDEAARRAGRDPAEIERAVNVWRLTAGPPVGPTSSHVSKRAALLNAARHSPTRRPARVRASTRRGHSTPAARAARLTREPSVRRKIVSAVADAPESLSPVDAAAAGLEAAGVQFFVPKRRGYSRQRKEIIDANPELQVGPANEAVTVVAIECVSVMSGLTRRSVGGGRPAVAALRLSAR